MERFREDLGDLTGLAESIKEIGLLHPIVKNSKGTLIAGARRLEACKIAGVEPTFTIVDIDNLVKAELHENTQRKDFTPKEIARISKYISETESRQFDRANNLVCPNRTDETHPRNSVADYVGVGHNKLSEINKIFDSGDVELQEKVNSGDISVHGAYKILKGKVVDDPFKDWSDEEKELKKTWQDGATIVINMNVHKHLLQFANNAGKFQKIDRGTNYGNPFNLNDGSRDEICDWYEDNYFPLKRSLHSSVKKLKGKVLGCHCYPERCHGETLIKKADES